jgi:hypothetical protein
MNPSTESVITSVFVAFVEYSRRLPERTLFVSIAVDVLHVLIIVVTDSIKLFKNKQSARYARLLKQLIII